MLLKLIFFISLLGFGLGCSCEPNLRDRPHSTAICEAFTGSENIFTAVVHNVYCKCIITPDEPEDFSCVRYNMDSAETQETFNCQNQNTIERKIELYFQQCSTIDSKLYGLSPPSFDLTKYPVTNLTEQDDCGFLNEDQIQNINNGVCALNIHPCYYTVNVTRVFKGNYSVGSIINTPGPDVTTTCGEAGRVLRIGYEYVVGVGGACLPIDEWSEIDVYESEDLDLLAAGDSKVCDSAAATIASIALLVLVALLSISVI